MKIDGVTLTPDLPKKHWINGMGVVNLKDGTDTQQAGGASVMMG